MFYLSSMQNSFLSTNGKTKDSTMLILFICEQRNEVNEFRIVIAHFINIHFSHNLNHKLSQQPQRYHLKQLQLVTCDKRNVITDVDHGRTHTLMSSTLCYLFIKLMTFLSVLFSYSIIVQLCIYKILFTWGPSNYLFC